MSEAAQPASAQAAPASEASQRETIQLLLSTRSTSRQLPSSVSFETMSIKIGWTFFMQIGRVILKVAKHGFLAKRI